MTMVAVKSGQRRGRNKYIRNFEPLGLKQIVIFLFEYPLIILPNIQIVYKMFMYANLMILFSCNCCMHTYGLIVSSII